MTRPVLVTNLVTLLVASFGCDYFADFEKTKNNGASTAAGASGRLGLAGETALGNSGTTGGKTGAVGGTSTLGGNQATVTTTGGTIAMGGTAVTSATTTATIGTATGGTAGGGNSTTGTDQAGRSGFGGTPTVGGTAPTSGGNGTSSALALGGIAGQSNTGGISSAAGGIGTGGSIATGGALTATGGAAGNTSVATGGVATGGAATGGAANQFRGGPCIASSDTQLQVEVLARGNDQNVYRRVVSGADLTNWVALTDLDGSMIDNRSDLDCSIGQSGGPMQLVALGKSPSLGSVLHAVGSGTSYSGFVRELAPQSFDTTPTILSNGASDSFSLVVLALSGPMTVRTFDPVGYKDWPSMSLQNPLTSGADLDASEYDSYIVAFDNVGQLALYDFYSFRSQQWTYKLLAPPTAQSFQYSPSVCAGVVRQGDTTTSMVHLAAVAGGRIWYTNSSYQPSNLSFGDWVAVSDAGIATSPDCTTTYDGQVHIVALDSKGQVVYVHGAAPSFNVKTLQPY